MRSEGRAASVQRGPRAAGTRASGGPAHTASLAPTLIAAFEQSAESPTLGLALVDRDEQIARRSWPRVVEGARIVALGLQRAGIAPGDRVGLVYPTSFEFVEAFFGCVLAGAVPAALYPPIRLGRLEEYHKRTAAMLESIDAELLLCDPRIGRILGETLERFRPRLGMRNLAELPRAADGEPVATTAAEAVPEDLCLIQFSSGTTVDPKPVALSHRAVMAQVSALNAFWPDTPHRRHSGVSWLPLYHDMGLIGCLFAAVERPGDLTLIPPEHFVSRPAVWLRTLSATRASISPAPNFAYGLCVDRIRDEELDGVDLCNWRVALNGAETVVASVADAFCRRFAAWGFRREAMTPVYGLSEAALAVTFSDIAKPYTVKRFSRSELSSNGRAVEDREGVEIVSVGKPLPNCELSLRAEDGRAVEEGVAGRLWVKGDVLMSGYFGDPAATAEAIRDGWLDTGDIGFRHEGLLYLSGRAKDVLILRGQNHRPEEVEHAIDRVPGVRTGCTAAVSHLPRGGGGEELLLFVERRQRRSRRSRDAALASRCREEILAAVGLEASRVEVLAPGTLPRTSSGKIRRQEALRRYLDGRLTPPRPFGPLRLLATLARSRAALKLIDEELIGRGSQDPSRDPS